MSFIDTLMGNQNVSKVNMLSHEGDIYLAELIYKDDSREIVCDGQGKPKRFHSIAELKEDLQSAGANEFNLVFHSPYDLNRDGTMDAICPGMEYDPSEHSMYGWRSDGSDECNERQSAS